MLHFRDGNTTWNRYGPVTMDVLANGHCLPIQQWPTKLREAFQNASYPDPAVFLSFCLSEIGCGIPGSHINLIEPRR